MASCCLYQVDYPVPDIMPEYLEGFDTFYWKKIIQKNKNVTSQLFAKFHLNTAQSYFIIIDDYIKYSNSCISV